jgi:hypothetical protein
MMEVMHRVWNVICDDTLQAKWLELGRGIGELSYRKTKLPSIIHFVSKSRLSLYTLECQLIKTVLLSLRVICRAIP